MTWVTTCLTQRVDACGKRREARPDVRTMFEKTREFDDCEQAIHRASIPPPLRKQSSVISWIETAHRAMASAACPGCADRNLQLPSRLGATTYWPAGHRE